MNPNVVISDTSGLQTHGNELSAPVGSTSVADNVTFGRERLPERRNGFKDYSTNLPDFSPDQLLVGSNGTDKYLSLDSGLWYWDTTSSTWLRKRGAVGAKATQPIFDVVVSGVLYYTANNCVFAINLTTGDRFTVAGRFGVAAITDGTGDAARFSAALTGICSDGTNLFVCDGLKIRKIAAPLTAGAGIVTTIAGGAAAGTDGTGTGAGFSANTWGIVHDGTNLFVCDGTSSTVRRVAPPLTLNAGVVTTIAGTAGAPGGTDATGAAARFGQPTGLAMVGTSLYVSDLTRYTIRRLAPPLTAGAAVVTTIAGQDNTPGVANGTGAAASFGGGSGICTDGTNLFVCDLGNGGIRKVAAPLTAGAGIVTTIAGTLGSNGSADGIGSAARFTSPYGICTDGTDLHICDYTNNTIRKLYVSTTYVATTSGLVSIAAAGSGARFADGILQGPS